ncbi:single-stranded DNA-binding protein [Pedobacter sp.]
MENLNNHFETNHQLNVVNSVMLTGFVGADAIIKNFGNQKLARINLAVNEFHKNASGETIKKTNWFNLALWNSFADIAAKEIKKGSKITIIGKLQTGSYEAKDGSTRYTTNIHVTELKIAPTETNVA